MNADACGFAVPHLTDHDDVGIMAQKGAQSGREIQSNIRLGLCLVHTLNFILYRVLDGQDLAVRLIEQRQRRRQCRRFAATGRTGDHDKAERRR